MSSDNSKALDSTQEISETFFKLNDDTIFIVVEDNDDPSSMENVLRELDKEKVEIVISKVIRRFSKPATIVRGLHDRKDVESITRDLKMKIGTGGTYKDKQIILQGDHRESVKSILLAKGFEEKSIEVL